MEIIMYYFIFATATALASIYELFGPVLKRLEQSHPDDNMIEHKALSYFVFFLVGVISAPLILPATLIPNFSEKFKDSLYASLTDSKI